MALERNGYFRMRCDVKGCGARGLWAISPGQAALDALNASWDVFGDACTCDRCTESGAVPSPPGPEDTWDDSLWDEVRVRVTSADVGVFLAALAADAGPDDD